MKKVLKYLLIASIWLIIWQLAAKYAVNSEILLPTPLSALKALFSLVKQPEFYKSVLFSVLRLTCGFAAGTVCGTLLAVLTFKFGFLKSFFSPVLSVVKSTPVASFIVLLFVWVTNGAVASFTSALIVLPVIHGSLYTALCDTDKKLLQMAKVFGVSKLHVITKIYIPSVMTQFKASAATAMGLCWKAGIAAEVICSPKFSIGAGIYDAKIYFDTPSLFAWTSVVIIVSLILEKTVVRLLKRTKGAEK